MSNQSSHEYIHVICNTYKIMAIGYNFQTARWFGPPKVLETWSCDYNIRDNYKDLFCKVQKVVGQLLYEM